MPQPDRQWGKVLIIENEKIAGRICEIMTGKMLFHARNPLQAYEYEPVLFPERFRWNASLV